MIFCQNTVLFFLINENVNENKENKSVTYADRMINL
jgi:hypothetical protein